MALVRLEQDQPPSTLHLLQVAAQLLQSAFRCQWLCFVSPFMLGKRNAEELTI